MPAAHDRTVIRDVILHLNNEQPLLADLYEPPSPGDVGLRCTNLRLMNGKRPVFVDDVRSIFFFPYLHIRFVEIPPKAMSGGDPLALGLRGRRDGGRDPRGTRAGARSRDRRGLPPTHPRGLTATARAWANRPDKDPVLHSRPCQRTSSSSNHRPRPAPSSAISAPITGSWRHTATSATCPRTRARASSGWTSTTTSNRST